MTSHQTPNESMEPTPSRGTIQLSMSSTRPTAAARALARGSSSCSRWALDMTSICKELTHIKGKGYLNAF